ncbi:MAG: SMI1/KNR4 family protein [Oscillospiraceae bacterium]|nr:SMI1/KNR4 family protein [Oscillospiraceae bacterium]
MNELSERFFKWAEDNGWNVESSDEKHELPKKITERYRFIPSDWIDFVQCFKLISNGADNIWFQLPGDFEDRADDEGFRWNEFELISLEAASDDKEWQNEIRGFWDNYLPVVMSVAGDYHYYAIGIRTGEIFEGWEPEFDDIEIVAPSFSDFIELIISGRITLN